MPQIYRLAKVTPPKVNDILPRQRLLSLLESYQQKQTQLIMIVAKAGCGKTSLAADFVSRLQAKVAWCDLETGDRNFAQFLTFLTHAIQRAAPAYNSEQINYDFAFLNLFRQMQANLVEDNIAPLIVSKLADALAHDINTLYEMQLLPAGLDLWLVLDNYQFGQSPANNFFLQELLNWDLSKLRVLVLAREIPEDFPFTTLRAKKRAEMIGPSQMTFEKTDTAALLTGKLGPTLNATVIEKIHALSRGWAVALRLILLGIEQTEIMNLPEIELNQALTKWLTELEKAAQNVGSGLPTGETAHDGVFTSESQLEPFLNYLTTTFLMQQPADQQLFMLQTSLLETLSLEDCQYLSGLSLEDCQAQLTLLENQHLILLRQNSATKLLEYHSLIRGALQLLFKKKDPLRYGTACRAAAQIYEKNGQPQKAVEYWLQAGESQQAARLVCSIIFKLLETNNYYATVKDLLGKLPEQTLETKARLLHARALLAQEAGKVEEAEELFERAIEAYQDEAESGLALKARADLAFLLAVTDRYEQASQRAEAVLEEYQPYKNEKPNRKNPELEWLIRAATHAHLALGSIGQRLRQHSQAEKNYYAAEQMYKQLGDKERAAMCQVMLAITYRVSGRLVQAKISFQQLLNHWERSGNPARAVYVKHYLASIERHNGQYEEALRQFNAILPELVNAQQTYLLPYIMYEKAECYAAQGQYELAESCYESAREQVLGGNLLAHKVDILLGRALNRWLHSPDTSANNRRQILELFEETRFLIEQNKLLQKQAGYWLAFSLTEIDRKEYCKAAQHLEQSLSLLEQHPDAILLPRLVFISAVVKLHLEDKTGALEKLAYSLQLNDAFSYYLYLPYEIKYATNLLQYAAGWLKKNYMAGKNSKEWQTSLSSLLPKFLEHLNFNLIDEPDLLEKATSNLPVLAAHPADTVLLELKGLDGGKVFKNGVEITQWEWPRARGLLFYLMQKNNATAERINADFWPDDEETEEKGRVYSLVSDLRKTLKHKEIIFKKNGSYWLKNDIISYDAGQFEQVAKKLVTLGEKAPLDELKNAAALYRQEYLENLTDWWAEEHRFYLKDLYIELLKILGQQLMKEKRYPEAIDIWQQLLAKDEFYDAAHESLIEAYKSLGRTKAASEQRKKYNETMKAFPS